jgi:magnesium transporter
MMKQTCYRLEKSKYLTVIPCADLPAVLAEGDGDYWQEIEAASPDELAEWIKPLALHPLMVEDILTAEHSTLIDRYGQQAVYIEFPTNLDEGDVGVAYLSIILRPHQIATIRRGQISTMQGLVDRFQHEIRPHRARTMMVLYYILDHFIDQNMLLALNLRNRIDSLEQTFADDPAAIELSEITKLKRETTALISVADDQRYCVKALESMHFEALDFSEYKTYLRDITSNAEQVLRVLSRSEERLKDLQTSYQLAVNNTSEKRLRVLTVVSAIFLPLTLITGFFGMNFEGMILLGQPYGIWLAILAMAVILLVLMVYFYRAGWFK